MLARDEDILKAAEDWKKAGRGVALATVVETWGSAPRPVGSNLVIDDKGNFGDANEAWPHLEWSVERLARCNFLPCCTMYRRAAWECDPSPFPR